jgi:predicted transcriptional regulator
VILQIKINGMIAVPCRAFLRHISSGINNTSMQIEFVGRKIDDERKDAILEMLSDRYCRAIIEATMNAPKSAIEISADCKIPISTVYRRLQSLHDNRLLAISGAITTEGKKHFLYKSKVRSIVSKFNGANVDVEIVPNAPC